MANNYIKKAFKSYGKEIFEGARLAAGITTALTGLCASAAVEIGGVSVAAIAGAKVVKLFGSDGVLVGGTVGGIVGCVLTYPIAKGTWKLFDKILYKLAP